MTLPLLISVPHAGVRVPPEVMDDCILSERHIIEDGDEGAREIFDVGEQVRAFVTTEVARAVVDVNRAEGDRRADGVIKTHTCWNVPVYRRTPSEATIERLLERYYRPYHARLRELTAAGVHLGIDCHTMAAFGPPIGPGAGRERPRMCLSNADGTCSRAWMDTLTACLQRAFAHPVAVNDPFKGGYIIRAHAAELPWVQLEISRAPFTSDAEKRQRVLAALAEWCELQA